MPGPVGKTPRHKLTAEERRRCIAALSDRHERRMRREEVAEQHAAGGKKTKKASRKKAAKHMTPAMEIAESKVCAASTERVLRSEAAEEKEPTAAHESAEAKETAAGSPETQTPSMTPPTTEHRAPGKERASGCETPVANLTTSLSAPAHPVVAEVVEVVEDIIEGVANSVLMGVSATLAHSPVSAGTSYESEINAAPGSDGSESDDDVAYSIPACAVDTDPNIMDRGANQCTALNSDEDPDLREEPENEEDADDDSWTEDWDKPRKFTKYFCPECSSGNRREYLCNVVREGREKTCFQIWHQDWSNGNDILRLVLQDHKVRDRAPPSRPNKKRRSSGQSHHDAPTRADSEGSVDEDSEDSCVMNAGSERAGGNGGGVTGDES
ncbi:hypothetical protein PF011_g6304 [Phytophthora fragariae]|uniref:PiggyBac transposable element-derived protein 4 C-terminal zinc-ribbon domain-containing protein n=1 Tax=Phytophthora fragariae TaxID=53985 RepID=A0A6A3LJV8_9STRA|nr:hypothetical protein PF011_g6304 [Phytophthora fragariae]